MIQTNLLDSDDNIDPEYKSSAYTGPSTEPPFLSLPKWEIAHLPFPLRGETTIGQQQNVFYHRGNRYIPTHLKDARHRFSCEHPGIRVGRHRAHIMGKDDPVFGSSPGQNQGILDAAQTRLLCPDQIEIRPPAK